MAEEDVKIHVRADADTKALEATEAKIKELYRTAAAYEAKGGMETAAKSVRSEAASLEKDVARYKREQHAVEKDITRERREQAVQAHAEESRRERFGRGAVRLGTAAAEGGSPAYALSSMLQGAGGVAAGLAGVAAIAAFKIADEVITDSRERHGIALRDKAAHTMHERGLGITAGWRGTSGQAQGEQFAIEQQMAERTANRPELERQGERKWYNPLKWFGGSQTWEGQRKLDENDAAQKRDAEQRDKLAALTAKKFKEEEGGIEMDLARHRAERSQSGQRAAFVDEQKKAWLARYRGLRGAGATDAQASQTAGMEAETRMRDRQIAGGSGLVDARSGAGDIAAAARWAGMSTPGISEVASAIGALHSTVKSNSTKAEELSNRRDQSIQ